MARLAGVDLPNNKRIIIGLQYIFGIGQTSARAIITETGINEHTRVKDLTDEEIQKLRSAIDKRTVEGDLRSQVAINIKRLMDIGSYRGLRHRKGLPVRGQRTKTNSRTRKGKRKNITMKKKEG